MFYTRLEDQALWSHFRKIEKIAQNLKKIIFHRFFII